MHWHVFFLTVQCEQQPTEEEEDHEVQQEVEAVIVEDDVEEEEEEEEGVVLQEEGCPAVIVEEVPSAQVEECYSAQVLVYDDEMYLMQDVAEEQEVVTEAAETGGSVLWIRWNLSKDSEWQEDFKDKSGVFQPGSYFHMYGGWNDM